MVNADLSGAYLTGANPSTTNSWYMTNVFHANLNGMVATTALIRNATMEGVTAVERYLSTQTKTMRT